MTNLCVQERYAADIAYSASVSKSQKLIDVIDATTVASGSSIPGD